MAFYGVKTTASQEETVVDLITEKGGDHIHAAMSPKDIRAYIIVEADTPSAIDQVIDDIPHANSMLTGTISEHEVMDFLEPPSDVENIAEGDLVDVIDGPYSGEKAKIKQLNEAQGRVTIELIDATVPIPVEMKGSQVRRLDSEERET